MTSHEKKSTPPGGRWTRLETPGDVRRYLKWLILETKADRLDVKKAGVLGQLGLYLLKTIEVSNLAARVAEMEQQIASSDERHDESGISVTRH